MLLHIPQILDADQVRHMRQALETAEWTDGRETVGAQGAKVKRNQQLGTLRVARGVGGGHILGRGHAVVLGELPQKRSGASR